METSRNLSTSPGHNCTFKEKEASSPKQKKQEEKFWVRDLFQARRELGHFNTQEMKLKDREYFFR